MTSLTRRSQRAALALLALVVLFTSAITTQARADELLRADHTTPRRAVAAFLDAAESGDYGRAAELLDLHALPAVERPADGPELARMLHVVLDRVAWIELAQLSDDPRGRPEDGETTEIVSMARVAGREIPITLTRTQDPEEEGQTRWLVSAPTVARIPKLYQEHGPGLVERRVPAFLKSGKVAGLAAWQWIGVPVAALVATLVALVLAFLILGVLRRITASTKARWDDELVATLRGPMRLFVAAIAFRVLLVSLSPPAVAMHILSRMVGIAAIGASAWLVMRVVVVVANVVERRARRLAEAADAPDERERHARAVATQVRVLRRVINVAVGIIAAALILMQWEVVRNIGVSLLASAGIAGIVLGFAAQRTIGSLIAGIQLSATQPIRIGDVVIVEKEWGTIEEVTLTYVIVKVWDERRLIIPVTRFLEQPFENWTKTSSDLHGTIFFNVDWRLPVDAMRAELDRIVTDHPLWDKRTKGVVVTDAKGPTLEVRALVSAADAGALWGLRVDIREKLVHWLQTFEGGKYLPLARHEAHILSSEAGEGRPARLRNQEDVRR